MWLYSDRTYIGYVMNRRYMSNFTMIQVSVRYLLDLITFAFPPVQPWGERIMMLINTERRDLRPNSPSLVLEG